MNNYVKRFSICLKSAFLFTLLFSNYIFSQNTKFTPPDWSKNSVIYEVNVRQYTNEGTFKAFEKHLPELKKMGVDILWLMPIHPIGELNRKGTLGSYYAVKDFKAVNPEFGTHEDFKNLVSKIHELKMSVIIDWVANHTSWDNVWTKTHPEFFSKNNEGNYFPPVEDWADVIDLNFDNPDLRKEMIGSMKYWVDEFGIDGFRCDVAAMVPIEFWIEARIELERSKKLFMLAEASEPYLHKAFDMTYNWQLKDLMNDVAQGKKKGFDIIKYYAAEKKEYNANDYRMVFTSNHDENTWHGTEYERLGDGAETFAVLCGTVPGMPLIYTGQETGMNKRLRFFDKDTVGWKNDRMRGIYTTLNHLKENNKALWNGKSGGEAEFLETGNDNILAFVREKEENVVFTVLNLSANKESVKIRNVKGNLKNLFDSNDSVELPGELSLDMEPWNYKVYFK